jgi:hypothetical protein
LTITNNNTESKIILIDHDGNSYSYKVKYYGNIYFDNNIMKNINYIYISNRSMEGKFELREYDHWFPIKHNIEIIINKTEFNYKNDKKIFYKYSSPTAIF